MVTPNRGSLDVGRAESLSIPLWAKPNFGPAVLNPLDMYASSRMIAFGLAGASGKRIWPWQRNRVGHQANQAAQGRGMLYSPLGRGVMM